MEGIPSSAPASKHIDLPVDLGSRCTMELLEILNSNFNVGIVILSQVGLHDFADG